MTKLSCVTSETTVIRHLPALPTINASLRQSGNKKNLTNWPGTSICSKASTKTRSWAKSHSFKKLQQTIPGSNRLTQRVPLPLLTQSRWESQTKKENARSSRSETASKKFKTPITHYKLKKTCWSPPWYKALSTCIQTSPNHSKAKDRIQWLPRMSLRTPTYLQ